MSAPTRFLLLRRSKPRVQTIICWLFNPIPIIFIRFLTLIKKLTGHGLQVPAQSSIFQSYALRQDGWTADAAGLPMLPGQLRYEEVTSGEIKHALRITTWTTQDAHIWPARHHSGIDNTAFPPMGQRFRLKASVNISKYSAQQQVILKAMKKYGMILADNSGNKNIWGLSAVQDERFDFMYSTFTGIQGSDFEAVDVSSLMIDEDSGKARITAGDHPHTNTNKNPDSYSYSYSYTNSYSYSYSYTNSYSDSNSYSDFYSYSNKNPNSYPYTNTNKNPDSDSYTRSERTTEDWYLSEWCLVP